MIHFDRFSLLFFETYAQHNVFPGQQGAKYIFYVEKLKGAAIGDGAAVRLHSTSDSSDESHHSTSDSSDESSPLFGGDFEKSDFY